MSQSEFHGVGWSLAALTAPRDAGGAAPAAYEDAIRQSVWIILATAPGERPMRPTFGCGIHDLVFSPGNATTRGQAAEAVREALVRWEPRIELLEVDVAPDAAQPTLLRVRVDYRVRTTNNQFNLVYPFYLDGGERSVG